MLAAVFHGPGDLRLEERPIPEPSGDQVLLRVAACGICGTDRHIMHGAFATTPPVVLGHEYAGTVVGLGPEVSDLELGQAVVVDPNIYCGTCRPCLRGQRQVCQHMQALGVDLDGGLAEFSLAPRGQLLPLPAGVSLLAGAMVEPLACCIHGIDRAQVQAGDKVAVIGGGAIGLMLAQLALRSGASQVLLSDPMPGRRAMAQRLGIGQTCDPTCDDPLAMGGCLEGGADVVIEAVGSRVTTAQALTWAAPGGKVLWFGVTPPGHTIPVEPNLVFAKELTILGARINPFTHQRALELLASGSVQVAPLITRQISISELPEALSASPGQEIKTMVVPA